MKNHFFTVLTFILCNSVFGQTVKIGNQVWMTKNLNVAKFKNGQPIKEAKTREEWSIANERNEPAWCNYDNNTATGQKYGKLYNFYAVYSQNGLCPTGWHVPSTTEWITLVDFLMDSATKMDKSLGYYEKVIPVAKKIKSSNGWSKSNGTNESGFNALPGGYRFNYGQFDYLNIEGKWWTSTLRGRKADVFVITNAVLPNDNGEYNSFSKIGNPEYWGSGLSVRCLKD
jgi:uncharacterized protein (TIGR02145 family)